MAAGSRAARPNSGRRMGCSARERMPARPEALITSISPDHRHITPSRETHSSTALAAPWVAAAVTWSMRPRQQSEHQGTDQKKDP